MYRNFGLCNFQLSTKHQTTSLSGLLHEKASRWIDIFTLRKAVNTAEIVLFWGERRTRLWTELRRNRLFVQTLEQKINCSS